MGLNERKNPKREKLKKDFKTSLKFAKGVIRKIDTFMKSNDWGVVDGFVTNKRTGLASLVKDMEKSMNQIIKLPVDESVNEAGMELNKLKDAIKMFQKKIKKQGRVTNARDEEHLKNLIKVYKQMGGKGVKESVNEVSGVDVAKKVLKNKQREKGIDLQTANLIVTIDKAYDKNPKLQKKFRAIQLPKMKQLIMKYYG